MGASQQRKGRNAERELSAIINGYGFHTEPAQALNFGKIPDIVGLPGIHIECKRHERTNLYAWVEQSETDAERFTDGLPIVAHRLNRKPWLITMSLETFIKLYEKGRHHDE